MKKKQGHFKGGDTNFLDSATFETRFRVEPDAGKAIIFIQEVDDLLHEGTQIISTNSKEHAKYVMRTDVMYELDE